MTQKIVAVDVDGVIADLHFAWLAKYNAEWVDNLKPQDITDWDISKFVVVTCGQRIFEYLRRPDLYQAVPAIHNARWGVETLRDYGFRVVFLSSCVPGMFDQKWQWLQDNKFLPKNDKGTQKDYIAATDKSLVRCDYMVDDGLHNLDAATCALENRLVFDQPWNRSSQKYKRVRDWQDVVVQIRVLDELSEQPKLQVKLSKDDFDFEKYVKPASFYPPGFYVGMPCASEKL